MSRFQRLFRLSLFALFLYLVYFIRNQVRFENFLESSFISWDDFPVSYAKALNESVAEHRDIKFDYSLFSKNDSSPSYSPKIPRIIHFIWFKNLYSSENRASDIPTSGSNAPELCRKYNPDYEIHVWNATAARDLFEAEYAWFLPTYDSYAHPIQRVDAFKYFLLWHYGGVYMDLDISCRRALDPLLEFPAWFPRASPLGVNNDLMASAARHPLMEKMTKSLKSRNKWLFFSYVTVFWSTGPKFTSDIFMAWFNDQILGGRLVRAARKIDAGRQEVFVLPQVFYSEEYTFFGHRPGGTWHGQDVFVILWIVERIRMILLLLGAVFLCALVVATRKRNSLLFQVPRLLFGKAPRGSPPLPLFRSRPME